MKKMFMMMLLSIVSWTGAVTATEATAPLKSNGPVAQQEAVVAADTLNGMTPSEAFQIRMKELEFERDKTFFQDEPDAEDIIDSLVPLFAIVSPFLIAFLIVFFYIYYRNKKVQSRYRVMEKAIESGRELPEGFFDEPESKRPSKFSTLNQELVCMAVGIGSFIWCIGGAYELDEGFGALLVGLAAIFTLIGIGKLILYRLESRKKVRDTDEQTTEIE